MAGEISDIDRESNVTAGYGQVAPSDRDQGYRWISRPSGARLTLLE